MKIGFVSAHPMTYPGGVQNHILGLKKEFEKRGHKVKVIFPIDKFFLKKNKEKISKDSIIIGKAFYFTGNASKANFNFEPSPSLIKKILEKENFDILHFQNIGIISAFQILKAVKKIEKKPIKILTLHSFWDASKILNLPISFWFLNKKVLPIFDGIIFISKPVSLQVDYQGPSKIIPNGVDIDFFKPKGQKIKKFDDNKINILFVGRLEKRKGLIYLLLAFERLKKKRKNIRLIVVGDGKEKRKLEKIIKEKKIKDVFFEGEIKKDDLPKYYRTADICCFPSIFGEAFGIVILEAMASGKPVVAFANKGYKEVLKGKGGEFLVKPKDTEALAEKLDLLIKNEKLRKEMGDWGRKEAEKYSWGEIAKKTLNFYQEIIKFKK